MASSPIKVNDTLDTPSPSRKHTPLTAQTPVASPLVTTSSAEEPVIEPKLDTTKTDTAKTITPEITPIGRTKTTTKTKTIPEDSIKHRLRNATLKPFKFLKN